MRTTLGRIPDEGLPGQRVQSEISLTSTRVETRPPSTFRDMAARTLPPFRADHVGSLLRPPALLDARARHKTGELDDDGLREVEDAAIRDVVALQREAGVRTATDGEFRRTSWHMDFIYQLEGVDPTDQKLAVHFHNKAGDLDFEAAALSVHDRMRPRAHDLRRRVRVPVAEWRAATRCRS